jgi:hypothetical protein
VDVVAGLGLSGLMIETGNENIKADTILKLGEIIVWSEFVKRVVKVTVTIVVRDGEYSVQKNANVVMII